MLCHFLGYLFDDSFRIHGYGFHQFFASSGFMGIVLCQNSFIGELFWHSRIYGYYFLKFLRIYGYTFEKFLRIYGWCFYDLSGTIPYLGNSSSPPPGGMALVVLYHKLQSLLKCSKIDVESLKRLLHLKSRALCCFSNFEGNSGTLIHSVHKFVKD